MIGVESNQCQFIEGPPTEEYGLENIETEKPLLEADDFIEVIRYHWISDINIFPNERHVTGYSRCVLRVIPSLH